MRFNGTFGKTAAKGCTLKGVAYLDQAECWIPGSEADIPDAKLTIRRRATQVYCFQLTNGWWPTCKGEGMILLVTPSARGQQCAEAVQSATGEPTDVVSTLELAVSHLRSHEYLAVVLDQFLLDAEPDQSDQLLRHLAATVPIYVNCAISGIERVVREVCSALGRRKREKQVARRCAEQAMWSELSGSVTAMLLSCDLALATPDIPEAAVQKIRTIHDLAHGMRARLEHDKSPQA